MNVNDGTFEKEVIDGSKNKLVLVDFWADWCVPCHMLSPVLEEVEKEYKDKIKLVKINTDNSPNTSGKYQISAIPAVKLFKDGKVVGEFVGVVPEETIKNLIDKNID